MYQEIQQEVSLVRGVDKEVEKLTSTLQMIKAVLIDAENRQVTDEVVKVWLAKLRDICHDLEDVLDDWSTAILKLQIEGIENARTPKEKVCSYIYSPCFCFNRVNMRHDIACKIKELYDKLDVIASDKERYNFKSITIAGEPDRPKTTSLIDVSEVYGRDYDKKAIVSQLLCESSQEERHLHIISIVGMGGIGKTTLAQLAYNDDDVKAHFNKRIWVCVSDPFDEIRIGRAIVKALDESDPSSLDWENLPQHIYESIAGKKFFLVLDDVWTEDFKKWEPLKHSLRSGAKDSSILVTTRNERVAKMLGTTYMHPLEKLSNEQCWSIFSQMALFERSMEDRKKLEEIGRKIADKCKGFPLAAKTLGSLMNFKKTKQEWQNILDSEIWEWEEAKKGLFPPLLLSYYDLPSALKQCFSYCSIFPKDYKIKIDKLIQLWMAQGYVSSRCNMEMEAIGWEYFENLAMRSFFQDFEKDGDKGSITSCKMHDIVHDFAQFLMEDSVARKPSMGVSYKMSRHLYLKDVGMGPLHVSSYKGKNLHTLFAINTDIRNCNIFSRTLSCHLKSLRALDLSHNFLKELPEEFGNLIHLRYLNISHNDFAKLPETLCDLCNLQTLNVKCCFSLGELPKGMGKLINLRHLKNSLFGPLKSLPKGIGRLSSLQTLDRFIIVDSDDREGCNFGDLENLNNLQGSLCIENLDSVVDVDEAEKAKLGRKKHLVALHLDFYVGDGVKATERKMHEIIEALQPHSNLEDLSIVHYRGPLFPSWLTLLPNLRKLELTGCHNCECLPPLGKLPSLESLKIQYMNSVKKVGFELLGIGIDGTASKDEGADEALRVIAFPKLKELFFRAIDDWEEWDVMVKGRREEDEITIMPHLRSLIFLYCKKLKALPHHLQTLQLEDLVIEGCPILEKRCREVGEDWPKISHIPNFRVEYSEYPYY